MARASATIVVDRKVGRRLPAGRRLRVRSTTGGYRGSGRPVELLVIQDEGGTTAWATVGPRRERAADRGRDAGGGAHLEEATTVHGPAASQGDRSPR